MLCRVVKKVREVTRLQMGTLLGYNPAFSVLSPHAYLLLSIQRFVLLTSPSFFAI